MTSYHETPDAEPTEPTRRTIEEIAAGAEVLFEQPHMLPGVSPRGLSPRENGRGDV